MTHYKALDKSDLVEGHMYLPEEILLMPKHTRHELLKSVPKPERKLLEAELEVQNAKYEQRHGLEIDQITQLAMLYEMLRKVEEGNFPVYVGDRNKVEGNWSQLPFYVANRLLEGKSIEQGSASGTPEFDLGTAKGTTSKPMTQGKNNIQPDVTQRIVAGAVITVITLLVIGFAVFRFGGWERQATLSEEEVALIDGELEDLEPTATPTQQPVYDINRIVGGGEFEAERDSVTVEIGGKIYPIKQIEIEADWEYEESADVASMIYGLTIKRVIGIPYSAQNNNILRGLNPQDTVSLTLSSGEVLRYEVTEVFERRVGDVEDLFDQTTPGIEIVLMGTPANDSRFAVQGRYVPQSVNVVSPSLAFIGRSAGQSATADEIGLTTTVTDVNVVGQQTETLPEGWMQTSINISMTIQDRLNAEDMKIALRASDGVNYALSATGEQPNDYPRFGAVPLPQAGNTSTVSAPFLIPETIRNGTVVITYGSVELSHNVAIIPPGDLTANDLTIAIKSAEFVLDDEGEAERLEVIVWAYNPYLQDIAIKPGDASVTYAPVINEAGFPIGPAQLPIELVEAQIQDGEGEEIVYTFPWFGGEDDYIGIRVGGWEYTVPNPMSGTPEGG